MFHSQSSQGAIATMCVYRGKRGALLVEMVASKRSPQSE